VAKFLVTGGCGFIGSHLCERLLGEGHSVRVLDNLSTGRRQNIPSQVELVIGDVADVPLVQEVMSGVSGCFHLAAVASVEQSNTDWVGTHRANLSGTVAVFSAARNRPRAPVPVVYASSAAVYGDPGTLPLAEDCPTRPLTAYGADKLGSELHGHVASLVHRVPTTGLRFFNVFGPRQDPRSPYSGVISIFAQRLLTGQALTLYGDGRQTRDFVYVSDVVDHLCAAFARSTDAARVFNVCTGRPTNLLGLAATIGDILGITPQFLYQQRRRGDIMDSLGNPQLARRHLGVAATTPLREGLVRTLDYLRDQTAKYPRQAPAVPSRPWLVPPLVPETRPRPYASGSTGAE
jgi:UDP-glucose 4-epimerase